MNAISLISRDSALLNDLPLSKLLYLYLLSNSKLKRGGIYADFKVVDVYNCLTQFSEEEIDTAFDELEALEVVSIYKGTIQLGTYTDGKKVLYTGEVKTLKDYFIELEEYADAFIKAARSDIRGSLARKLKETLLSYADKLPEEYTVKDYMNLFRVCYEIVNQDYHREFQNKEFGQMKNVSKLYDNFTVIQMILYYSVHYEKWSKVLTIAGFQHNKDFIYDAVKNKDSKTVLKTENHERGF